MRSVAICASLCVGIVLAVSGSVRADLIDLDIEHLPRLYALDVQVDYVAGGGGGGLGLLTASGYSCELYEPDENTPDPNDFILTDMWAGTFSLSAKIDPVTKTIVRNDPNDLVFTVTGDPLGYEEILFDSSTLAAGPNFGFGGQDLLQFKFVQEGAGLPPEGGVIGVVIAGVSIPDAIFAEGVLPTFDVSFSNSGNGYSDSFYLPEPATAALLVLGALGLRRRRR